MSLRNIGIVYRKELVDSLRDRRTVLSMIVVPILLMPLLTIGIGGVLVTQVGRAMEEVPKVMILGGRDSPNIRKQLEQFKQVNIVPEKPDYAEEISNKQIRAAVEIPEGFDAKLAAGEPMTVKIYMYEGEMKSGFGADRLQKFFRDLRDRTVQQNLQVRQLPETLIQPFTIKEQNVAPAEKVGGAVLGGPGALFRYFVVPDRRDVSGHGSDGGREGTRNDRNDSVHPDFSHASGPRKIPDGSYRFACDGGAVPRLDGRFLRSGKEIAARRCSVAPPIRPCRSPFPAKRSLPSSLWCFRSRYFFPRPCWPFLFSRKALRKPRAIFLRS